MSTLATRWGRVAVQPLRRPGGRPPLFFVSAPDVNALGYVALARHLDAAESPYAVQARSGGRARAQDYAPEEYAALASEYLAVVRARQPSGPYYLAGMCDGAHLAFEMARRLEAEGERVALLAILDTWPVENSAHYPLVLLESLRRRIARRRGWDRIVDLGRAALLGVRRALHAAITRDGAPRAPSAHQRWRARVWPGPGFVPPRFGGPITVLRVRRQAYYRVRDASLGWAARSAQPVRVHVVPGDHQTLLQKPHVAVLARTLAGCLSAARAAGAGPRDAPRVA